MFLMRKLLQILLEDQNLDYFILPIHVLHYAYVLNYYINRMIRKKHRSKAKCPYLFLSPKIFRQKDFLCVYVLKIIRRFREGSLQYKMRETKIVR